MKRPLDFPVDLYAHAFLETTFIFNITSLAIVTILSQNLRKPTAKCTGKLINTPSIQAIKVIVMNWEMFLQFYLRLLVVLGAYYLQA